MSTGRSGGQRQQGMKGCMSDRALDVVSQRRADHSGSVAAEPTDAAQDGSLNQDRSDTQQDKFYYYSLQTSQV